MRVETEEAAERRCGSIGLGMQDSNMRNYGEYILIYLFLFSADTQD